MITSKMYNTRIVPVDVQKPKPGPTGPGPQLSTPPIYVHPAFNMIGYRYYTIILCRSITRALCSSLRWDEFIRGTCLRFHGLGSVGVSGAGANRGRERSGVFFGWNDNDR